MPSSGSDSLSVRYARLAHKTRILSAILWVGWMLAIIAAFWVNAIVGMSWAAIWAVGVTLIVWAFLVFVVMISASESDKLAIKYRRTEARDRFRFSGYNKIEEDKDQ